MPQRADQHSSATDLRFEDKSLRLHLDQIVSVPQHQDGGDVLEVRDIGNHGTGQVEMLQFDRTARGGLFSDSG